MVEIKIRHLVRMRAARVRAGTGAHGDVARATLASAAPA
jgi:hypothetical protein